MGGLMMFDYFGDSKRAFDQAKETKRVDGLRGLMGDYYGQQDPRLGEIARLDPNAAAGVRKDMDGQQDRKREQLGQFAALLVKAPPAMRPGLYKQMHGQLSQIIPDAPLEYSPEIDGLAEQLAAQFGGGSGTSGNIQSTFVGADGMRYGVTRDGRTTPLGMNAPNNQIIDTGNGFYGVNKGNLSAAPVMVGGGQQSPQQPAQGQPAPNAAGSSDAVMAAMNFMVKSGMPAEQVEAWGMQQLNGSQGAPQQTQAPMGGPLRKAAPGITPFQQESLDIRRQAATAAAQARDAALAARQDAAGLKANQAAQAVSQRQAAAVETADGLTRAIDTLTSNPGFSELGSVAGDLKLNTPLIRSNVKDAEAQLKNIAGQVALATMSKLKALSSQGATGFGALSAQELRLLENSIATLQSDQISNKQLSDSLAVIKGSMKKVADWKDASPAKPAPDSGAQDYSNLWSTP